MLFRSILDTATGQYHTAQRRSASAFDPDSGAGRGGQEGGFDLPTPLMHMVSHDGRDRLTARLEDGDYALDLTLTGTRGPVLHGFNGYAPYGPGGWTFYYSRPRMAAAGALTIQGQSRPVRGTLWFDRQWGNDLHNPWLAWRWFSLRLDDGRDIMLFHFDDTAAVTSTFIDPDNTATPLTADDYTLTPTAWWTSPRTRRHYPVAWTIAFHHATLILDVAALIPDQEFDARPSTMNIYWEGLCAISGFDANGPVVGLAYVEQANIK